MYMLSVLKKMSFFFLKLFEDIKKRWLFKLKLKKKFPPTTWIYIYDKIVVYLNFLYTSIVISY